MKTLLGTLSIVLLSLNCHAELMYQQDWEEGILGTSATSSNQPSGMVIEGNCYNKATHGYNSMELSSRFTRSGSKSIRNELHGANKGYACPAGSYLQTEKKSRQEYFYGKGIHGLLYSVEDKTMQGDERWIGGSYYYPSNEGTFSSWWKKTGEGIAILQLFGTNGSDGTPELFVTLFGGGKLQLENYTSTAAVGEQLVIYKSYGEFKPDTWNDVVIHWKRNWTNEGLLEVWVNGTKVMSRVNTPVSIRDKPTGSIKSGQYFGTDIRPEVFVQYQDAWKIGGPNSSYAEVDPANGTVSPPKPPTTFDVQ